jgi:hypothetical protein
LERDWRLGAFELCDCFTIVYGYGALGTQQSSFPRV